MDHAAEPTDEPTGERPDPDRPGGGRDRDLAALEALEQELASLEGALERVEHPGGAAADPGAEPPA